MAKASPKGRAQKARPFSSARAVVLWENIKSILGALLVFLALRAFLVEAYRIPSGSMIPSLLVGDWLFVNKLVYGPHIPFTKSSLPGYADPKRNDIVVFVSPYQQDHPEDRTPTLVKRLVGEPGDTIYMRKGILYVDGIAQRQGFGVLPPVDSSAGSESSWLFDWQKPLGLKASRFGAAPATPTHDDWGPLVIPARHFFMMGDNRYNSEDGRYWGFVPRENVRGRPLFIYYSYNGDDSDRPLPFITDIRWSRIGHWVR
ncbi:MAG: signal peptidase I [Gemmatimonadota bacterium]|nr:signal peptidase I [Gemmatimonadota bacterium]